MKGGITIYITWRVLPSKGPTCLKICKYNSSNNQAQDKEQKVCFSFGESDFGFSIYKPPEKEPCADNQCRCDEVREISFHNSIDLA